MANISVRGDFRATVSVELTEEEAGALAALFSYNCNGFLDLFYKHMGNVYLKRYEEGFRSLHATQGEFTKALERIKAAREVFQGSKRAVAPVWGHGPGQCGAILETDGHKINCMLDAGHKNNHRTHAGYEFGNV